MCTNVGARSFPGGTDMNRSHALLGTADVMLVANGAAAKTVDASKYTAVQNGRTLPIKFRIEQGAVAVLPASGGSATIGPAGGAIAMGDDVGLVIPAGALSSPT